MLYTGKNTHEKNKYVVKANFYVLCNLKKNGGL